VEPLLIASATTGNAYLDIMLKIGYKLGVGLGSAGRGVKGFT
jgi:hypothetical protein